MAQATADLAVIGLGVMGWNLARNARGRGFAVTGFDVDEGKRQAFAAELGGEPPASLQGLVAQLRAPRVLLLMVPAGAPVDAVLAQLRPWLAEGDVVIDGGNTNFMDTQRRLAALSGSGLLWVGAGISGGQAGALRGPSIMPGGDAQAWPVVRPLLQAIAARAPDGEPCCEWMGAGAAGHFVKTVHNGIEYAEMQALGEVYWLLQSACGLQPKDIARVFAEWNRGELESYLLGVAAEVLARDDPDTGAPLVDVILDVAQQKGTGKWATQTALDLGVAVPGMGEAVFARALSAMRAVRQQAARALAGPRSAASPQASQAPLEPLRLALLAARLCAYAQGFELMVTAEREYRWGLPLPAVASVWRAGCIIRAQVLQDIRAALQRDPALPHLLLDAAIAARLAPAQQGLREVVAFAATQGVPAPVLMSALAYHDGLRSARFGPAALVQAQRDFFGQHGLQRVDRSGLFHIPGED